MKQSVICPFFGKLRDRFCEYGEDLTVTQKLERIAAVPGVRGVEIVYPQELQSLDEVAATLARLNLEVSAVNVNVKSDREFVRGSVASPDPAIRQRAVEYLKRGKDAAAFLGAERVTCCPLSDGHDYAFQTHYGEAWRRMVAVFREAALHRPEITLCMEYKPWETRVHGLLTSAAKTVLLCQAIGAPGVGVTVDIGHSAFGGESPADSLALVVESGLPYYVHTNDNNGRWDWDLVAGACNLWEYVEFLYYLKEYGFDGWLTSDVAPFREDAGEIFALNVRQTQQFWDWLDTIDREQIRRHLLAHEFLPVRRMLEPHLFAPAAVASRADGR